MTDKKRPNTFPVVGVGSSAGGLEALGTLLENVPESTSAAYVIIQHLAPDQPSILDKLLQTRTPLLIKQIEDGDEVSAGAIFIAPPGAVVELRGNTLHIEPRERHEVIHRLIDQFLKTLAKREGRRAFCAILSGTGSDGADGLRAIKAKGGFAFVQKSEGARFPGMPNSAVATGLVDFILPAEDIPARIEEIARYHSGLDSEVLRKSLQNDIRKAIPDISRRLAEVSGNDFSKYKPGTLVRRIERRMSLLRTQSVEQFIDTLDKDVKQAELLAQEFLIGVTRFFRDPEVFAALRAKVIAPLVKASRSNIRIWVPGCSTGEEVYTLAMIFYEEMARQNKHHTLQIFGTDIDSPALIHARYGLYAPAALENFKKDRLERFFAIENGQYRVRQHLRESCVFAPHNLIQDPPFSRIDLVSCRNLLIYLSAVLQKKVMPRFHFALREHGYLLIGPSEGLADSADLFDVVDKQQKIYRKDSDAAPRYSALRDTLPRPRALGDQRVPELAQEKASSLIAERSQGQFAEREFLRKRANPFAMLSGNGHIRYLSEGMTSFVSPVAGVPSPSIDAYLARELRVPVRSALDEAAKERRSQSGKNILVGEGGDTAFFDIHVDPIGQDGSDNYLLTMHRVRTLRDGALDEVVRDRDLSDRDVLESENFSLRRQLSGALQEYETNGQELKSTNEELLSMNEELQSSNEELETSREELQSINEELETVNAELMENNRQLQRANSDLKNLFESTEIAVLFLDPALCVRNFTPAAKAIFGIKARDIGRPISDLSSRIEYPELREDTAAVEESLQSLEREVRLDASDETYLVRMKPYRTTANLIDGYVLSFVNITSRKRYEETLERNERELARQYAELENLYDTTPVGLSLVSPDFQWLRINEKLAEINGFTVEEHKNKNFRQLLPDLAEGLEKIYGAVFETGKANLGIPITGETAAKPGIERNWILDLFPVGSVDDVFAVGACVREVTEYTRLVEEILEKNKQQRLLVGELQHRVKNTLATISAISRLALRPNDEASDYQQRLTARIKAMARTHEMLTQENWSSVSISDLIESQLGPYATGDKSRYTFTGNDFELGSEQAAAVGIALHELATNAAKHGALSRPSGSIKIKTRELKSKSGKAKLELKWVESSGPAVSKPERSGFGTLVLEDMVTADMGGKTNMKFKKSGLEFTICFPKSKATAQKGETEDKIIRMMRADE